MVDTDLSTVLRTRGACSFYLVTTFASAQGRWGGWDHLDHGQGGGGSRVELTLTCQIVPVDMILRECVLIELVIF
jgi:hypothetical protein